MKRHESAFHFQSDKPIVLTIGTFDGVHEGHRSVLRLVTEMAQQLGGESTLLTFDPHPRIVLHPKTHGLALLNTMDEKCVLLEEAGLDHLIVHPFTADIARMKPFDYVRNFFVDAIKPVAVIVGYDHRFGKNREGDLATLIHLGESFGFQVKELPAHYIEETRVSSTKVRQAISEGNMAEAAKLLGDWYPLSGHVVSGQKIGRKLGFPTANLKVSSGLKLLPCVGVYAAWAEVEGERFGAMVNIGVRPTLVEEPSGVEPKITVEAHFLDGGTDLYGMAIRLHFVKRVRDEQAFPGLDALKDQLRKDKLIVSEILSTC